MDKLDLYIEALIFAADQAIKQVDIKASLQKAFDNGISEDLIYASIERLKEKYQSDEYSFEIIEISKGYLFMTKGAFHHIVAEYLKQITKRRLSRTALETLSIIAYKQPVTKPVIEQIRGVNSDYSIQKLLDKDLIEIKGRDDGPGRPLIYQTSGKFMDYFGLRSMNDLPSLKDFEENSNAIGSPETISEEEE